MADPEVAHRKVIAERLLELTQHPAWDYYIEELESLAHRHTERLLTSFDNKDEYYKGVVQGLRLAIRQPDLLMREFLPGDST